VLYLAATEIARVIKMWLKKTLHFKGYDSSNCIVRCSIRTNIPKENTGPENPLSRVTDLKA
jgi:hypothetical protein